MSILTNRISGGGTWGMHTEHLVMMLRDPDQPEVLPTIELNIPAGSTVNMGIPAGSSITLEIVAVD